MLSFLIENVALVNPDLPADSDVDAARCAGEVMERQQTEMLPHPSNLFHALTGNSQN